MKTSSKQRSCRQGWKRYGWCSFCLLQIIVFLVAAAKPANAYVDPGSGLLFLQVGGSMLAGAMFVLRAKIRKLFRLGKPEPTDSANHKAGNESITGSQG